MPRNADLIKRLLIKLIWYKGEIGDETDDDADAISGRYHKNIIIDHVLVASWSIDETVSTGLTQPPLLARFCGGLAQIRSAFLTSLMAQYVAFMGKLRKS